MSSLDVDHILNLSSVLEECGQEPVKYCPKCGARVYADWVDIGFGPYSQQAGPHVCDECGWVELGCAQTECLGEKCHSWKTCKGEALKENQDG